MSQAFTRTMKTVLVNLDSWTEHFVVSLWSNQQMRLSGSIIYWYIPDVTPTCFSNSLSSSGGRVTSEATQAISVLWMYMDYNLSSVANVYIYIYIYIYIYTYKCVYILLAASLEKWPVYVYIYTHTHTHSLSLSCSHSSTSGQFMCVYIYVYLYLYVYIYTLSLSLSLSLVRIHRQVASVCECVCL
jgi:hypothetical protein